MPRRNDITKILVIGSGPIVIGQSAEFDYSGTQACKALKAEGYEVVLVNSNPATIMTDPELADRTYIEPLTPEYAEEIIRRECERMTDSNGHRTGKFALLPTVGGQTALNLAVDLADAGILEKYDVEMIGARLEAIKKAEDRLLFKDAMARIGLDVPRSALVNNIRDGSEFAAKIGFPVIVRPSFTLGGSGGGIAYNREELMDILGRGLDLSPVHECLIEESVLGWKEYELEVIRDLADNVIIICSIENMDPMGVHTGDSITVAPAQTLTDREYQSMRDAAIRVMREIGVETGGSNVQFAVNPATGRMTVIEMNPRVSRSSALASKATGFPIAKIAAKLAVGYTLDEIPNDITRKTPACFEPSIDYVVVKIPKWQFEKFPGADENLGPQMKSVGEVMALGRTFKEALMKALRSLDTGKRISSEVIEPRRLTQRLVTPQPERLNYIRYALRSGLSVREVARMTSMDPWFLYQIKEVTDTIQKLADYSLETMPADVLRKAKRMGISDARIAEVWDMDTVDGAAAVRELRRRHGVTPVFKKVDTCAAEFDSDTPYLYSTYEEEDEAPPTSRRKVIILGSGPNRIGQGIEFDYCCCHAAFALSEDDYETIMVNCNPETVSTDYDTSDRLYFEPLTLEDVLAVYEHEASSGAEIGMIVQFGGQTPLNLALPLKKAGITILGTSPESIDLAEDRKRFGRLLEDLNIPQPPGAMVTTIEEALEGADRVGYPVLVRPILRAGRPGDGDCLRRRCGAPLHGRSGGVLPGAPGAGRSLSRGCGRSRRGRAVRRQRRRDRRDHAAYRRSRHPLRRLFLRAARGRSGALDARHHSHVHPRAGAGPERGGPGEPAVRHSAPVRRAGQGLRHRSESSCFPHRALRLQGDRSAAGEDGCTADDRAHLARVDAGAGSRAHGSRHRQSLFREIAGLSLEQVSRCGYGAGTGDEVDRRSDGCGR